jgi:HSP20 family protein
MTITNQDLASPLSQDFSKVENLFGPETSNVANDKIAPVNAIEKEKSFVIEMAVPGVKEEDLKLNLSDGILSIEAKKEEESENYVHREFSYGSFLRFFRLPEGVAAESIEASFEGGILKILLPKKVSAVKDPKENVEKDGKNSPHPNKTHQSTSVGPEMPSRHRSREIGIEGLNWNDPNSDARYGGGGLL